jgi:hypothetical protein
VTRERGEVVLADTCVVEQVVVVDGEVGDFVVQTCN